MRSLSVSAIAMAVYAGISADQIIALLSAIVTLCNVIIEVIKAYKEHKEKDKNE